MGSTKSTRISSGELSTIIGPDAELTGNIKVTASMRVDGRVVGDLFSSNTVTIGSEGTVSGNITARDIIIGGKIKGTIKAENKTVLEANSLLTGDLKTSRLVVEEGAQFNGNSDMGGIKQPPDHSLRQIKLTED